MSTAGRRSVMSVVAERYLRVLRTKRWATDPDLTAARLRERAALNEVPFELPSRLRMKSPIDVVDRDGMRIIHVGDQASSTQVLYLHGGAYINQPSPEQWRFIDRLVQGAGVAVTAPIYPKAPVHHVTEALEAVHRVWQQLTLLPGNAVILGDSAGGGLALALAQELRDGGLSLPSSLVLLSPWVDAEMRHPAIPALEATDPMLSAYGLVEAGRAWAGELDPADSRVSPLNGDLHGLPPLVLFVGTRELFLPDVRALRDKALAAGVPVDYHEAKGQNHDYPLFPIPEATAAVRTITEHLRLEPAL